MTLTHSPVGVIQRGTHKCCALRSLASHLRNPEFREHKFFIQNYKQICPLSWMRHYLCLVRLFAIQVSLKMYFRSRTCYTSIKHEGWYSLLERYAELHDIHRTLSPYKFHSIIWGSGIKRCMLNY